MLKIRGWFIIFWVFSLCSSLYGRENFDSPPIRTSPSKAGPHRNDPDQGIPRHAYSPFDQPDDSLSFKPVEGIHYSDEHLVIRFKPELMVSPDSTILTDQDDLNRILSDLGIVELEPVFPGLIRNDVSLLLPTLGKSGVSKLSRWYRAKVGTGIHIAPAVEELSRHSAVEVAEPDYFRRLAQTSSGAEVINSGRISGIPNEASDPKYADQWHLPAVKAPEAWSYLESQGLSPGGDRGIVIAVIDTGVDLDHEDLAVNIWTNSQEIPGNGIDDDQNGYIDDVHGIDTITNSGDPNDDHGHGTHVAGIIAAHSGNGVGGVGVAFNTQIMAIKAAQYSGILNASDIAEAVYYAVAHGADVINMSFGGYSRSQVEEDALAVAFGQAVLVAAAGNDGKVNLPCPFGRDSYPAAYNWVLGVMASEQSGEKAGFSNFDCTPRDSHEYELLAPGVDIWSTLPLGQYSAWDGTSMAAPVVAGIAALVRTKFSDKAVYSSRFIMGQIASNASPVADAIAALTIAPKPELSFLEFWLFDTDAQASENDDDGIVDSGETIDLALVIRNHWGKADPVSVKLEAWAEGAFQADPYITMITGEVDYGATGSFNVDDNGLIYNDDGTIPGVRNPFTFSVSPETPNDHVIPFRVTMTANNGLDPSDSETYVFEDRFYLVVQKGRVLPRIISEDMTLTKNFYWIIPDQTLIESGVTLDVTEGTQIQFWSADPDDPFSQNGSASIQVEGVLNVMGGIDEPVEIFPSGLRENKQIRILGKDFGLIQLQYAKIFNPFIRPENNNLNHSIDHCFFATLSDRSQNPTVVVPNISNSIFHKLGHPIIDRAELGLTIESSLFDSCFFRNIGDFSNSKNNVFLKNFKLDESQFGERGYYVSGLTNIGVGFTNNAILNIWWDPEIYHWMRISNRTPRNSISNISHNYWGNISNSLIDAAIFDYNDNFNFGRLVYEPVLDIPPETAYPFVYDVQISTGSVERTSIVGFETITFTVRYNRDMDETIQPAVSFGPDVPETDYTVHPLHGGWLDARTWVGTFDINPITGDGYQLMRIAGGRAVDDHWLIPGDDSERFRFEIITSGTESMNLQTNGGEGLVELTWTQNDFDLLAGFNIYRSTEVEENYARINSLLIPSEQRLYKDTDVDPGRPYYYKFNIVKTDLSESGFSNTSTATPLDTIPPNLQHNPLTAASPGLPLTIFADVTDNVLVQDVILYYRELGNAEYAIRSMTRTTGNRYSATIGGDSIGFPGVEYYIQATDGITVVRVGRADLPFQILVEDKPVVTAVSPNRGPASGGTTVTLAGSNFKSGATVSFNGAVSEQVTVENENQILCVTPSHFPSTVDIVVINPNEQSGRLLRGFSFESELAILSLPQTGGAQNRIVEIPVSLSNVQGLASVDFTVSFNDAVLRALDASPGNLVSGWSFAKNLGLPGRIRISMASSGGTVSASGNLAVLQFEVVGVAESETVLTFLNVALNDGAIQLEINNGSFRVDEVYDVSGTVRYWNGDSPVSGVQLVLEGDRLYSKTSGNDGQYTVSGADSGEYVLRAEKSDDIRGISAFDASLILQHSAGLIELTGFAALSADINKSGAVSSFDAFLVLQKVVGLIDLPFSGAGRIWEFSPLERFYPNLIQHQDEQDFTAVLIGDVSGNWSTGNTEAVEDRGSSSLPPPSTDVTIPDSPVGIRVIRNPNGGGGYQLVLENPGHLIYSLELTLDLPGDQSADINIERGPLAQGMVLVFHQTPDSRLTAAFAGATPIGEGGVLMELTSNEESMLFPRLIQVTANEGAIEILIETIDEAGQVDSDRDGLSDADEVLAGTDPLDSGSTFRIVDFHVTGEMVRELVWSSVVGRQYRVLYKDDVESSVWKTLKNEVRAESETTRITDGELTQYRIYRVEMIR